MEKEPIKANEIKKILLDYHAKKDYKIFESFPIISQDPTVMFTNAAITPFKHYFTNLNKSPRNYALIQKCFRMGGASELESVGNNPYSHTFFEMFGSGTFETNHTEIIRYLLELLDVLEIEKQRLYFTIPDDAEFENALAQNNINSSNVFIINNNDFFWQEWRFGKLGPVGKGLTTIYSRSNKRVLSVNQMIANPDQFIELLNLIYIYGKQTRESKIAPISNLGFDLGIGIERLTAVLQKCNTYQIDSIKPLVEIINVFSKDKDYKINELTVRIIADHLRAICVLINEGLKPSNKKQGYVLRKLIRRYLELVWISTDRDISMKKMIEKFCIQLIQCDDGKNSFSSSVIIKTIEKENKALNRIIKKAKSILEKQPDIPADILWNTYGLSQNLARSMVYEKKN